MLYRVIKEFTDLQDNARLYRVDDIYPRYSLIPTPERVAELSGEENKQGVPLIEPLEEMEPEPPKEESEPPKEDGELPVAEEAEKPKTKK